MSKITEEMLFDYFQCKTTAEEEQMIKDWYSASEDNRKCFENTLDLYETMLLNSSESSQENISAPSERRRRLHRIIWAAVANVAAIAAIFAIAIYVVPEKISSRYADAVTSIEMPAGQRMDLTLSDGTSVRLNSGARITYPNVFDRKQREVTLSGEAYFDVAHNDRQPFVVKTFASDIEVLGTEFNVRAEEQEGIFSTTLVEGAVRLRSLVDPGKSIIMHPGQTVCLSEGRMNIENRPVRKEVRWLEGVLDISGLDFTGLMAKLEKAYGVEIVIERATIPEIEYADGELRVSDGIDYALNILRNVSDFTYFKDKNGVIHIK